MSDESDKWDYDPNWTGQPFPYTPDQDIGIYNNDKPKWRTDAIENQVIQNLDDTTFVLKKIIEILDELKELTEKIQKIDEKIEKMGESK